MEKRRCKHCGSIFHPSPRVGDRQGYCSRKTCQRVRKRLWTRNKLRRDKAYRQNQVHAQKAWRQRNPDYWRQYRQKNSEYAERNREAQRERNRQRKAKKSSDFAMIAKMDAIGGKKDVISGIYRLLPLKDEKIANMDSIIVEIRSISGGYSQLGPDCK